MSGGVHFSRREIDPDNRNRIRELGRRHDTGSASLWFAAPAAPAEAHVRESAVNEPALSVKARSAVGPADE